MKICPFCKEEIDFGIYRNTVCPKCGKNLHVCLCCRFYDKDASWHCRENIDELVKYVDEPNFCDRFELTNKKIIFEDSREKNKGRKAFDSLFGE
ncbi:MAG: hypothetical protein WC162_11135 [Sphaerochaetaceae bacterium]|nr:hypothetical protein [Sphaerochaetaceae bacterium]